MLAFVCWPLFWDRARWIYYNTKVLNTILSEDDRDRLSVDYEKTYKKYDKLPQPRIIDMKYAIDLYPERRAGVMRADTIVQEQDGQAHLRCCI